MPAHRPYHKASPEEREEILTALLEGWSEDWEDDLCLRKNGSMVWQASAVDIMILVDEIYRLRRAAALAT